MIPRRLKRIITTYFTIMYPTKLESLRQMDEFIYNTLQKLHQDQISYLNRLTTSVQQKQKLSFPPKSPGPDGFRTVTRPSKN